MFSETSMPRHLVPKSAKAKQAKAWQSALEKAKALAETP